MDDQEVLTGGNATTGVVRIGDTVRKPWTRATPSVHRYMSALRAAGIDVPAVHGRDGQGRQVIEYVPGTLAMDATPLTHPELRRVGALVRAIHDASGTFRPAPDSVWMTLIPAPGDDLVCHNDLAPWNLLIGDRWVFIDWDAAAPSTRLWDLAYAAQSFALNDAEQDPVTAARALVAFVDGYEADAALRSDLPSAMGRRAAEMLAMLRRAHQQGLEPWSSMYTAGHGDHWRRVTRFVQDHRALWREALGGRDLTRQAAAGPEPMARTRPVPVRRGPETPRRGLSTET